jgi:predicted ATPase
VEISAISVENYKSFSDKEKIEIKPLTVFIGKNSSGKSTIARLPLLIGRALSERAESTIELGFDDVDFGDSFVDLIHNRIPHGAFGIGMTLADEKGKEEEFWVKLQHFDEYKMLIVSLFQYKSKRRSLSFEWIGKDPIHNMTSYEISDIKGSFEIDFVGIWPTRIRNKQSENIEMSEQITNIQKELNGARLRFQAATKEITYLGPFREAPERTYRFPGKGLRNVGFGGKKAPELLGDDFLRRRGALVGAVSDWFAKNLGGWQLGISRQGDRFALVMKNLKDASLEVNIVDVGTGIAQVLPIVVQRYLALITGDLQQIEIVEQPELHLHPGAHGGIADLYLEAIRKSGSRFIVETHSENFLLRVRRRIAEQSVDNNKVRLYWFDDERELGKIIPINITIDGSVDKWPSNVFSEDLDEVRAIRQANRRFESES